jgi:hypothetical protein
MTWRWLLLQEMGPSRVHRRLGATAGRRGRTNCVATLRPASDVYERCRADHEPFVRPVSSSR